MAQEFQSMLSHVSIGTDDMERACGFYDSVMPALGAKRINVIDLEEIGIVAVAYGREYPEFWVNLPENQLQAQSANGVHFAFSAPSKSAVDAFWTAAIAAGALPDGEPGPRPHYGQLYYGCFVRDLDGHKIEAMFWGD